MNPSRRFLAATFRYLLGVVCTIAIVPGDTLATMPSPRSAQAASPQDQAAKIPPDQLDSLVAPIALYPDPMLAQTLAASTYPLEVIQLQQWLVKNPTLKDNALADAVMKQPWDPSVQALAALPEVVKRLADDIQWTTDLGNAFLAQQSDVMDAVQRMRKKALDTGAREPKGANQPLPAAIGQCSVTHIATLTTRLGDDPLATASADGGAAATFVNGGSAVSYERDPGLAASTVGDPAVLCLMSIPRDCPEGDLRGRVYYGVDLNFESAWWVLPDSEHLCGGA